MMGTSAPSQPLVTGWFFLVGGAATLLLGLTFRSVTAIAFSPVVMASGAWLSSIHQSLKNGLTLLAILGLLVLACQNHPDNIELSSVYSLALVICGLPGLALVVTGIAQTVRREG